MKEVKFCDNNFSFGTEDVVNKLKENHSEVTVEVEPCLGYCSDCAVGPFALVDDAFIQADTADELYTKIEEAIK